MTRPQLGTGGKLATMWHKGRTLPKNLCRALEALKRLLFGENLTWTVRTTQMLWGHRTPARLLTHFFVQTLLPCRCSVGTWTTTPRTPTPSRRPSRRSTCGCTPRCAGGTAPSGWSCWAASSQVGFPQPPRPPPRPAAPDRARFVPPRDAVGQPEFIQSPTPFYLSYKMSSTWLSYVTMVTCSGTGIVGK